MEIGFMAFVTHCTVKNKGKKLLRPGYFMLFVSPLPVIDFFRFHVLFYKVKIKSPFFRE